MAEHMINSVEKNSQFSKKKSSAWFEFMDIFISVILIITVINIFFFRVVKVDGESMLDTLHDEDRVVLKNFLYTPKNGDIVVVAPTEKLKSPIIKRVIATEGQSLKFNFKAGNKDADVYVNGNLLNESYIYSPTNKGNFYIPEIIPQGYVFVMGDNRSNSKDSRDNDVGLVDVKNILGKAEYIFMPFSRFGSPYKSYE